MKRIFLILGLLLAVSPAVSAQQPITLRVMTYNIFAGRLASLEQIAGAINSEEPDVVALQELDHITYRPDVPAQHGKDFSTELGYHTGMLPLFGKAIPHAGGQYGIGLLSRNPYLGAVSVELPKGEEKEEQRVLLFAFVGLPTGDTIVVASTHVDYSSEETATQQIAFICRELESVGGNDFPVLLGGDFNSRPDSPAMAPLFEKWQPLCGPDNTTPANDPNGPQRIDYLFGWPADWWKLVESRVPQIGLSDHLPVVSTVELLPKTERPKKEEDLPLWSF